MQIALTRAWPPLITPTGPDKYQINFSVTGVLGKNTVTSDSQRIKSFLHFQLVQYNLSSLGIFLPILTNPVPSTMGSYHTAML